VVWRLERLGRSTSHLIQTVTKLGGAGHRLPLSEAIDTTTSARRLLFGILASLAAELVLVMVMITMGAACDRL